jgi:hypothetical protein
MVSGFCCMVLVLAGGGGAPIRWYDCGGWYGGEATSQSYREQLLIDQFKESFGGEKKREYSFIEPASFLGKIAVSIHSAIGAVKKRGT